MAKNRAEVSANENMLATYIDKGFDWLKKSAFNNFLNSYEKWFGRIGLFTLYIVAVLSFIVSIVIPAKYSAFSWGQSLSMGCSAFFIVLLFQYIAAKSIPCLDSQVKNTSVKISTACILDITCLLNAVCAVFCLIGGLVVAINLSDITYFLSGIGIAVFCIYWMAMAMEPESLNVKVVQDTTAGEEFIGLLTFFAKGNLKLMPIAFCGCALMAAFQLCEIMFVNFRYQGELYQSLTYICFYVLGALLPLAGYISFLFYYFAIDIARAILSLPEKLSK